MEGSFTIFIIKFNYSIDNFFIIFFYSTKNYKKKLMEIVGLRLYIGGLMRVILIYKHILSLLLSLEYILFRIFFFNYGNKSVFII